MEHTYNITVKCNSEEDRDQVLETLDQGLFNWNTETLIDKGIIRYSKKPNVFFSESENGMKVRYSEMVIM